MSGQTFAGPNDPLYLSTRGVNSASFNKLSAPPLAYLDKGIMYELDDGILYFNGMPLSGASGTIAEALGTTGADVVIGTSAPPVAGDILVATSAIAAEWQTPDPQLTKFADNLFDIHNASDPTKTITFSSFGTTGVDTNISFIPTVDRAYLAPDADGFLLISAGPGLAGKIPMYTDNTGGVLNDSDLYVDVNGFDQSVWLNSRYPPPATFTQSYVAGAEQISAGLATSITGSVVLGSRCLSQLGVVSGSVVIGDGICYQGATGETFSNNVIVGNSFGANGNFVTACAGNVSVGNSNGFFITSGNLNTLIGTSAGSALTSGVTNTFLGATAGQLVTTGNNNILINHIGSGPTESDTIRIGTTQTKNFQRGIRGITTANADAIPVLVDSLGQLGTVSSSLKYKENVIDMPAVHSEALHKLRAVEFNYIGQQKPTIGLIAEEVEKVYPEMCIYQPIVVEEPCECPDCLCHEVAEGPIADHGHVSRVDRELLTVDYQRLSIMLLKEVQEIKKKLDAFSLVSRVM